jgi:hypothetical protein
MKMGKIILILFFTASGLALHAQQQVINAAGDHRQLGTSGVWISDNVGEPFTETIGPMNGLMITQGFYSRRLTMV